MTTLLERIIVEPSAPADSSVIWLHGLGADGNDFAPILPQLTLAANLHIRFIFPHAPVRPVTINGGYSMPAWYDILGLKENSLEDAAGINDGLMALNRLIEEELQRGIPPERIILVGFSQGGALALHCGLRYHLGLGGIIGLSTYLPLADTLVAENNPANRHTPIMLAHGADDDLLPPTFGQTAANTLINQGYKVDWLLYPRLAHSLCLPEIRDISTWLNNKLAFDSKK